MQIREQIPRLKHVDPRPEYRPNVALGEVVPTPGMAGALLARIRAQKARLRSVPMRISCVQVGRVLSQRSQSATRFGAARTPPPISSETAAPYASDGETTTTAVLPPRAMTMIRSRRLGRRGQFEQMGGVKQRQIRSPSVRVPNP